MKKILNIFIIAIVLCITAGVVLFVLNYTDVFNVNKALSKDTSIMYTDDGKIYTERKWTWKPIETRDKITYESDTSSVPTRKISLTLGDNEYYDITIPSDIEIIQDFGKTVWAVDGSYQIRLIKGVTLNTITSLAGIDDGTAITQSLITTADGKKGRRSIALLLKDDVGVVADIYSGNDTYSIIRDSLMKNNSTYVATAPNVIKQTENLSDISYIGNYAAQVVFQDVTLKQQQLLFADGLLYIQSDVRPLYKIVDEYLIRLSETSTRDIDILYRSSSFVYAESGDYILGLIYYNSNTTITLVGQGEEAKCNIISIISYLQ